MKQIIRGRFAPTPSGFLHLGNVFCSLLAWLHAKSQGGSILLRVEDLDVTRCPSKNADQLKADLEWLGLTWDEGAYIDENSQEYFQSKRSAVYEEYFHKLEKQGLVYPCFCSRSELHAAEAPILATDVFTLVPAAALVQKSVHKRLSTVLLPIACLPRMLPSALQMVTTVLSSTIWLMKAVTL